MLKHHYPQVLFKYGRYSMSLLTQKKGKPLQTSFQNTIIQKLLIQIREKRSIIIV